MKTIKYYRVEMPFGKDANEQIKEYNILAQNKYNRLCVNDISYTTLQLKKEKYGLYPAINEVKVWKQKWGTSSDGYYASVWFQGSEKIMRRKVLNALKKEISKEYSLNEKALEKINQLLKIKG